MPPPRRTHGRPPGMPSRCRPSATPSLRSAGRSGARWNYRCPGQARRPSKFPLLCFSAWSTPSATPPDATHIRRFSETLNRSDQVMAGGKSSSGMESIGETGGRWPEVVELSQEVHDHLRSHAVPLDSRAIAHLAGSALALDLYAFLVYRLPRLRERLRLSWGAVTMQFGTADTPPRKMAQLIHNALVEVQAVYPEARVEAVREGLLLRHSPPSVPARTLVAGGLQLILANTALAV